MSRERLAPGLVPIESWWRSLARRAFAPIAAKPRLRYLHAGGWSDRPVRVLPSAPDAPHVAIVVPALAPLEGSGSLEQALGGLAASLERLQKVPAAPRCLIAVALQDRQGASRREEILLRLEKVWAQLNLAIRTIPFVGISVSQPSKILALNSCLPLLETNEVTCLIWFDDDVEVMPDCLPALWQAFDSHFAGVYGARKVASPDRSAFSRLWARTKSRREPHNRYPHGCAMMLSRQVFGEGIPLQYITDDHYYLFHLLQPAAENPLELLRVVPQAVVRVPSANSARVALSRTTRNYRNLQRVLADVPDSTIRYFMRELHFPGLRLARSRQEWCSSAYWLRLAFDGVKRVYWELLSAEILLRGLLGVPRRTVWFSAPPPHTMETPTPESK